MTSFAEALKKGLDVHKRAEEARNEMAEVLAAASREVSEVLGGEISFQFESVDRPARGQSSHELIAGVPAPREKFQALTARTHNSAFKVLAEAGFGAIGYPVTLRWENEFRMADDRDGFESVIKDLLAHGVTGSKIEALLRGTSTSETAR